MKAALFLFYLLLTLLPTQLARHFFFGFSQIFGIRSDYLAPTLYLTDILIIFIIVFAVIRQLRSWIAQRGIYCNDPGSYIYLLFAVCYLLFNTFFIASNHWVAFFRLLKIIEFILLGLIIVRLKPRFHSVVFCLSISLFYSSILAIWQFFLQKSVGGWFWLLGERTFYASTPGIAAYPFQGNLLLRSYATFPHPNVLAGFIAVALPVFLYRLISLPYKTSYIFRIWLMVNFLLGSVALILTFGRGVWLVALVGFALVVLEKICNLSSIIVRNKNRLILIIYSMIIISIGLPIITNHYHLSSSQSLSQRGDLINIALEMTIKNPLFGVGLNNYLIRIDQFMPFLKELYLLQPVHNIYLLIISEMGIVGFGIYIIGFLIILNRSFKTLPFVYISLLQLFLLGLFDHYLITLQQGQLLLTVYASLAFLPLSE